MLLFRTLRLNYIDDALSDGLSLMQTRLKLAGDIEDRANCNASKPQIQGIKQGFSTLPAEQTAISLNKAAQDGFGDFC